MSKNDVANFFHNDFPKLFNQAKLEGKKARLNGLLRTCNLPKESPWTYGKYLKVYLSAWEQGYDGFEIPEIFNLIERMLNANEN